MDWNQRRKASYAASPSSSSSSSISDNRFGRNPNRSFGNSNARQSQYRDGNRAFGADNSRDSAGASLSERGAQRVREQEFGDLEHAPSVVGSCPFMCPEKERVQRERLRDLAVFERLHGNPGKTSSSLAVKKFCRTITIKDVQASDIRPLPVLEATLKHLLEIVDSSEQPFDVIHDFMFDRTRSIRQDLSMQNITNDQAIWMYEKMVSFHVISHHRLQRCNSNDPNVASMRHLNIEQLTKSLASLYNLYDINRDSDSVHGNESEFRSLYVLLHLGSDRQASGEPLSLWFCCLPSSVLKSKGMSFARRVLRAYQMGNYWRFFLIIAEEATYLQFCIIEPYVNEVRINALACINHSGYKLHPYPLANLCKILRMQESDMESLCGACGLEISIDDMGNMGIHCKQTSFLHPKECLGNFEFEGLKQFDREGDTLTASTIGAHKTHPRAAKPAKGHKQNLPTTII